MVARASLLASPVLVVLMVVLMPMSALAASSVPACGHANLNNPGHHYGLIKNGCVATPSGGPSPAPAPTPAPKLPPVAVGNTARNAPAATSAGTAVAHAIPVVITPLRATAVNPELRASSRPANAPADDRDLWVVIALLPFMLVLWLLLLGIASANALQRRKRSMPVPA